MLTFLPQIDPISPLSPLFFSTARPRQASISSSVTSPGPSRTPSLSPSPPGSPSSSSSSSRSALYTPPPSPPRAPRPHAQLGRQTDDSPSTFRLVPTSLSQANAILYVPPLPHPTDGPSSTSAHSTIAPISHLSRTSSHRPHRESAKALLLVGPAMDHLRGPEGVRRQIALGARVHPYRIVPRSKDGMNSRRSSIASTTSTRTIMSARNTQTV